MKLWKGEVDHSGKRLKVIGDGGQNPLEREEREKHKSRTKAVGAAGRTRNHGVVCSVTTDDNALQSWHSWVKHGLGAFRYRTLESPLGRRMSSLDLQVI